MFGSLVLITAAAAAAAITRSPTAIDIADANVHFITPTVDFTGNRLHLSINFQDKPYHIYLEPNKQLFSMNYKETIDNGEVSLEGPPLNHCHYHVSLGDLLDHPQVHGAISIPFCSFEDQDQDQDQQYRPRTPRGLLSFSRQLVALEPVEHLPDHIQRRRTSSAHTHALIRLSSMPDALLTRFDVNRRRRLAANTKWVELLVVNDRRRFDTKGAETQTETAAIVNAINNLYHNANFDPPIRVILVAQHTFTALQDPWESKLSDPANVDTLINEFHEWRYGATQSKKLPNHDNGQLFSSRDFKGSTVGYAGMGVMCLPASSGGIDQITFAVGYNAGVVAHEMGHNFKISHDSGGDDIMSSSATAGTTPSAWSQDSLDSLKDFFASLGDTQLKCLDNKPTSQWGDPVCGNGFVETGEDCDPVGADACCDASTCKFVAGAVCSDVDGSKCCKSCQYVEKQLKKVCRLAADPYCDIPEFCDGESSDCPSDIYTYPGAYCKHSVLNLVGACYATQCKVYTEQCTRSHLQALGWSSTTSCMDEKTGDDRCGDLICSSGSSCISRASMSYDGTVVTVDDGTPCAIEHQTLYSDPDTVITQPQCKNNKCVDSKELAPTAICGNGVTEETEECDCGQADDPCCVCATCTFKPQATCSNCSPCCEQCQPIKDTSSICRTSVGPCDLAEQCDGKTGVCPEDAWKESPSTCTPVGNTAIEGSCQPDGSCKTILSVCGSFQSGKWTLCDDTEADGNVDTCGDLKCRKKSDGVGGSCVLVGGVTTAGLPCTDLSKFTLCDYNDQCKVPAATVALPLKSTLVVCSGMGTYGIPMPVAPTLDPNSIAGIAAARAAMLTNCTNGTAVGSEECDKLLQEEELKRNGGMTEQVKMILIIVGASIGALLLFWFCWWYNECHCDACHDRIGRCRDQCSDGKDSCSDCCKRCTGMCKRSPEAAAAAAAKKHDRNKARASKKRHRESKKREKTEAKDRKKLEIEMQRNNKLAPGWTEEKDEEGRTFYWNDAKGESSWVKPTVGETIGSKGKTHRTTDTLMPTGWEAEMSDDHGRKYYVNPEGESQWDRPPGNEHLVDNPMAKP